MNSPVLNQPWHPLTKIVFRFFFVFIALEILLCLEFPYVLLGFSDKLFMAEQEIFTPSFLWLNEKLFHFQYTPIEWLTFTPTLWLIRLIVFLIISLLACIIWTLVDMKRIHYSKADFWLRAVLVVYLSGMMWGYGIIKIFPVQMPMPDFIDLHDPIGQVHPVTLLWATLGYGAPYQIFTGFGEVIGAILILFSRTRLLGLLILFVILCNIVMLNYTYEISVLQLSSFLLFITLYLLIPYIHSINLFFFTDQTVNQLAMLPQYTFKTKWKRITITLVAIGIIGTTYVNTFITSYSS